jgi:hypothetical protein
MIVARRTELTKAPVVITVGRINAGVRENIIPEELTMAGTIRTLDSAMQKEVHEKIRQAATRIAESMGATAEVSIDNKTLVTYNTPGLVKKMLPSLEKAAGKGNVLETEWVTGAEDFSFFGEKAPAFYFNVGGMPKGKDPKTAAAHHTPDFYLGRQPLGRRRKGICQYCFRLFELNRPKSVGQDSKSISLGSSVVSSGSGPNSSHATASSVLSKARPLTPLFLITISPNLSQSRTGSVRTYANCGSSPSLRVRLDY